jgi:hypothetical protein
MTQLTELKVPTKVKYGLNVLAVLPALTALKLEDCRLTHFTFASSHLRTASQIIYLEISKSKIWSGILCSFPNLEELILDSIDHGF